MFVIQKLSSFFHDQSLHVLTVRGDLVVTLKQLLARKDRFDYILIETTGAAHSCSLNSSPTLPEILVA